MINLTGLLRQAQRRAASDVHIKVGNVPFLRVNGELHPAEGFQRVEVNETDRMLGELLNDRQKALFAQNLEIDLSFGIKGLGRFRLAAYKQRGTTALNLRLVPPTVESLETLNLPGTLAGIADSLRGLVLVTGVTGSGKSTAIASMIRHLNETRPCHILTIEDPIEFLFQDQKAIISQREILTDTPAFASALRAGLRQDPDVIMVGEMRDLETVQITLQAAQTGHLVLTTLHTTNCITSVDRIITLFPTSQQQDVRVQFAAALNAVVSIRLIRSSLSGNRFPAVEILRNTDLVSSLICQPERTKEIRQVMESGGSQYGMQTFDQSILTLFSRGLISQEDALRNASQPADLELKMKGFVTSSEEL